MNKLPGYTRLLAEKTYTRYFPRPENAVVRVFWVCRSTERITSLRERFAKENVAQFFRFTTIDSLTPSNALTTPIWQDLTGKPREILRLPTGK